MRKRESELKEGEEDKGRELVFWNVVQWCENLL